MGGTTDEERPMLPPGRVVELPGRGHTFVRELRGRPGAPVVVLLHGWSATAALNWYTSFTPLAERFRVIALDHRGHGRGIRTAAPFRLEDCADDVAALLGVLHIERCIAVGYSMGGPIGQLLWQRHPHLVQGLVMCATSATFNGTVRERMLYGAAVGGCVVAGAVPIRPLILASLAVCRGWRNRFGVAGWGLQEVARHDWTKIIEAGREIGRFDARSWVADTSVPTAVIATNDDDVVPHQRQLALAAAIRGTTVRVVSGGHSVCTAAPERFVPALVDACTEVAHRAASDGTAAVLDGAA